MRRRVCRFLLPLTLFQNPPRVLNELEFSTAQTVVLDLGSGSLKVGFAGEDKPRFNLRSCRYNQFKGDVLGDECFKKFPDESFSDLEWALELDDRGNFREPEIIRQLLNEVFCIRLKIEQMAGGFAQSGAAISATSASSLTMSSSSRSAAPASKGLAFDGTDAREMDADAASSSTAPALSSRAAPGSGVGSGSAPGSSGSGAAAAAAAAGAVSVDAVLVLEPIGASKELRRFLARVLFSEYKILRVYFGYQPIFAMFGATGLTSGLSVEIGDHFIQCVPMYRGFALRHAFVSHRVGGRDLTRLLRKKLEKKNERRDSREKPVVFSTVLGHSYAEKVKEHLCTVSPHPLTLPTKKVQQSWSSIRQTAPEIEEEGEDLSEENIRRYILPNRNVLEIEESLLRQIPEALFNPDWLATEDEPGTRRTAPAQAATSSNSTVDSTFFSSGPFPGLAETIELSFSKCDEHMQELIQGNVVLTGGSSLFPGLPERLEDELREVTGKEFVVVAPDEREIACWVGGSMFASFQGFPEWCVKRSDYEESGDERSVLFRNMF